MNTIFFNTVYDLRKYFLINTLISEYITLYNSTYRFSAITTFEWQPIFATDAKRGVIQIIMRFLLEFFVWINWCQDPSLSRQLSNKNPHRNQSVRLRPTMHTQTWWTYDFNQLLCVSAFLGRVLNIVNHAIIE